MITYLQGWALAIKERFGKQALTVPQNSPKKVQFRRNILDLQWLIEEKVEAGELESKMDQCTLKHLFTPVDSQYGCCAYAREIFIPKGTLVIGKIHRHRHLNFILKGKVSVGTEFGIQHLEAPCTFISEIGLKRAVYAKEDVIWTTVHLTKHPGVECLEEIEEEVIAEKYEDIGLTSSVQDLLERGTNK